MSLPDSRQQNKPRFGRPAAAAGLKKGSEPANAAEAKAQDLIFTLSKTLPCFADGRINYRDSEVAPAITVFVRAGNEVLLLKRSGQVGNYQGKWSVVTGYLDEPVPIRSKILEELRQELGVNEDLIASLDYGDFLWSRDEDLKKTWLIVPVLVCLKSKPEVILNEEHTGYAWARPEDFGKFDTVPDLLKGWKIASQL